MRVNSVIFRLPGVNSPKNCEVISILFSLKLQCAFYLLREHIFVVYYSVMQTFPYFLKIHFLKS